MIGLEKPPLWTCPRCGARFETRNRLHSCGPWTVDMFLKGKGPKAHAFFNRFMEMAERCGPVTVSPLKTRVTIMVRIRFAAIQRVSEESVTVSFWLKRKIESTRFQRVDFLPPNKWLYTLRINSLDELDDEIQEWLYESYKFGARMVKMEK